METALEELCILVSSITQASKVSISAFDRKNDVVNVIARSTGAPMTLEGQYALDVLGKSNNRLLLRDVNADHQYSHHPLMRLYPTTRSFAGYLLMDRNDVRHMLAIWNPSRDFFDNQSTATAIDHVISIACQLILGKETQNEAVKLNAAVAQQLKLSPAPSGNFDAQPSSRFLMDTLVKKQRLLVRNGCSYVALRQWRKTIKPYQLSALTALKSSREPIFYDAIGNEMAQATTKVFGNAFQYVVPIPAGSSGQSEGMSHRIAKNLAEKLNIPFADVLAAEPVTKGASHPKKSVKLQPYQVTAPIDGNILIIDDVATSGRHIELATNALRPLATYCTSMVWIAD